MDLEQLITNYYPPQGAVEVIRQTNTVLIVGISGAGKDTIKRELLALPEFQEIISHTTRAPRANAGVMEIDGVDYHFIDMATAQEMLVGGEFVEAKLVHGTVYGTSVREVARAGEGGVAITDVDVQGVAEYKAVSADVRAIFVVPPDYDTWVSRLRQRYATAQEFEDEWPKRRNSAIQELSKALDAPYYQCVVNDTLDQAVQDAMSIALRQGEQQAQDAAARQAAKTLLEQIRLHDT